MNLGQGTRCDEGDGDVFPFYGDGDLVVAVEVDKVFVDEESQLFWEVEEAEAWFPRHGGMDAGRPQFHAGEQ